MCEIHICTLDFGAVLKDRLRPPDRPIAQQGIHTRGYSEAGRGDPPYLSSYVVDYEALTGPSLLQVPQTICIAESATCIDNAPDTLHPVLRPNRMLIICVPRNHVYTHTIQKIVSYKRLRQTLSEAYVDVSYAAPQAHRIVNAALHQEYSLGIVFLFSQGRKDLYHV
jgi:hypothetical protein